MKVFVVGGDLQYVNFLPDAKQAESVKDADIVVFADGPAVSPSLYNEKKLSSLSDIKHDINRDRADKAIYKKLTSKQLAIGIGRGSGFLAVMNGAKLIQYSRRRNINSSFDVKMCLNQKPCVFSVISENYQPIYLGDASDFKVLGLSKETDEYYIDDNNIVRMMKYNGDPEIVEFHKKGAPVSLCIQFRPDWMPTSYMSQILKDIIYECANQ